MSKKIALLGSTGSIGTQALDIISKYPDEFSIESITAGNNADLLIEQARTFLPGSVVIANEAHYKKIKDALADLPVKVYAGTAALEQVVAADNVDVVLASMVGYSGLGPTLAAIRAGKTIALANKETLVVAGHLIREAVQKWGSRVVPVDSEHSAILQCLAGETGNPVEKISLTASGGPFLNVPAGELKHVKAADALKHPNWFMGSKITIDSASMMNKGLEVIEAKWLFDLEPSQIDVVIHPQSIIHSMVHFADGSVKAQLGIPDMRVPILYALTYPSRFVSDLPRLDFSKISSLTFFSPDYGKFRNLSLAFDALKAGGNMPCIMNAANEVAVCAFLEGRIGFLDMPVVVEHTMGKVSFHDNADIALLENSDMEARRTATDFIYKN
ncbi:MAG: 1-deoxy-D-xylulose-5-phosphate reductoisomerase [Bacteroidales bacterium]